MSSNDLTGTEASALVVLMAEARAVRNPELKTLASELTKSSRDKLETAGLIAVNRSKRPMTLELTDKGWRHCHDLLGSDAPAGSAGASKALFTVLAGLGRWLDREDRRPAEVFFPRSAPADIAPLPTPPNAVLTPHVREKVAHTPAEVESRIRATYDRLVREPGGWVRLSRLRPELQDIDRSALDEALARLRRASDVSLIPEENQKTLTEDDRAAAVFVGNQHNHLLAIEQ